MFSTYSQLNEGFSRTKRNITVTHNQLTSTVNTGEPGRAEILVMCFLSMIFTPASNTEDINIL